MFGSICYIHVPAERRHKLEVEAYKGIFLGYSTQSIGYRIFNLTSEKNDVVSPVVKFDEASSWNWEESKVEIRPTIFL